MFANLPHASLLCRLLIDTIGSCGKTSGRAVASLRLLVCLRGGEAEHEYEAEAEAALEEMDDAEMEERELEETEDLLEYYLQRAANTQSEAERLLAGARDLEESIGVSLSARRFEVRPRATGEPSCMRCNRHDAEYILCLLLRQHLLTMLGILKKLWLDRLQDCQIAVIQPQ